MFYRLLGMAVWKGGRLYLARKYDGKVPARIVAGFGGILILAAGALLYSARRGAPE